MIPQAGANGEQEGDDARGYHLSGAVLGRLLAEAKDQSLPDVDVAAQNCVVYKVTKYRVAGRSMPFYLHAQSGHRTTSHSASWDYDRLRT